MSYSIGTVINNPLEQLPGVGKAVASRLHRLGITDLRGLSEHFPHRYEDWTNPRTVASLRIGEKGIVIRAKITKLEAARSPRRRMHLTHAELEDETGRLVATWFNQPYLAQTLPVGGTRYFRGTVGFDQNRQLKMLASPTYEANPLLVPIYGETAGLTSRQIRLLLHKNWSAILNLPDNLPTVIRDTYRLPSRKQAVAMVHQPKDQGEVETGQHRFAFEELFWFAVRTEQLRQTLAAREAPSLAVEINLLKEFVSHLPFNLTDSQRRAAWEIIQDLGKDSPMNRLLNGDVGTGKTVIAAFATFVAARSGYQTIWLAPTEILAEQHHRTLAKLLAPFDIPVHLLTSSHRLQSPVSSLQSSVTVGTHAVLHNHQDLTHLGLVIIDEQHRFGVVQRTLLREQRLIAGKKQVPHFLSMTATPIPRTLALALYGDLDLTTLREYPKGRKAIMTKVVPPAERESSYQFIRAQIQDGRQVYVVCPLIEESESTDGTLFREAERKSAITVAEELQKKIFPEFRVGLLHGRLKPKEKQQVMEAFLSGASDILVATAVIEVGVDVANASVMLIEGAERFGLAQLHQLRGRVGRGELQSFCFLFTDNWSEKVKERLQTIEQTADGFALAEADLKFRGPGQFLGTSQTGFPEFKLASFVDFELMTQARETAKKALADGLIDLKNLEIDVPESALE
jgi:ATP-dependent DNA helicase RecG